ncbi:helix-turn-helix domain-containing protein [Segeticoccus rhizosphaerae]|uniref:helix-turn-helix domain-containing protein n=1 Tax=Segeticoccus rhizosphaerae TaxID=1104777 RepID=UPI0012643A18|nr:helix-turn-helix transcriptional regulator [Segeticoccus rhizosphaerae]
MGNQRLRSAMDHAGVTIEGLARDIEVDPKTVQRWLAGRIPHARHRWAVADRVDEDEEFLWPGARRRPAEALGSVAELVAAYAYRSDAEPSRWWTLITGAQNRIDLMGYTLYFLPEQHPDLIRVLSQKCAAGCRIRMMVASPEAESLQLREVEEHAPITLSARLQTSLIAFKPLLACDGAQLRYQDVPLYNSVFRFDDEMFMTPHLYATPGHKAPLLHLRRLGPNGLFDRFAEHFEAIWAASEPA